MGSTNVQDGREGCLTPLRKLPVGDHADFFAASWPDRMGLNVYMVFEAVPRKKAGFQRINIQTELSNSELEAPRQRLGSRRREMSHAECGLESCLVGEISHGCCGATAFGRQEASLLLGSVFSAAR